MAKARRPHGTGSVYHDPRGYWIASIEAGWSADGTRRRRRRVARSERDARAALREMAREIDPGQGVVTTMTVKTWADRWLPIHQGEVRPHAYATDRTAVTKWIVPTIGTKRLGQLTPGDIRSVDQAQRDAGLAPSSVIRTRSVLHKLLKDALSEGHDVPKRALMVRMPPRGEGGRGTIPLAHALSILAAAATKPDGTRWVAAFLGMRPAEALGLTWECIHEDRIEVMWQLKCLPYNVTRDRSSGFRVPPGFVARHLRGSHNLVRPKTASGARIIPLTPGYREALLRWRDLQGGSAYGLVWPRADGRPQRDEWDRAAWRALCKEAGVPAYDLYSARHTAVTLLKKGRVDDGVAAALVGHSKLLESYRHIDMSETLPAIEGLSRSLGI